METSPERRQGTGMDAGGVTETCRAGEWAPQMGRVRLLVLVPVVLPLLPTGRRRPKRRLRLVPRLVPRLVQPVEPPPLRQKPQPPPQPVEPQRLVDRC